MENQNKKSNHLLDAGDHVQEALNVIEDLQRLSYSRAAGEDGFTLADSRCLLDKAAVHLYGHERRDQGFTDAAFAADDGDDVFDMGAFMRLCQKALWFRTAFTVAGAAGTVVITVFTHCVSFSFCGIVSRFSRTARQNGLQHEPARSQTWILPPWMSRRLPYTSAKATL